MLVVREGATSKQYIVQYACTLRIHPMHMYVLMPIDGGVTIQQGEYGGHQNTFSINFVQAIRH